MGKPTDVRSFAIIDDPREVVSIDVLDVPRVGFGPLVGAATRLMEAAAGADPDFIAGAVHRSLPPLRQPLVWLPGAVPLGRRQVALYARWRSDGQRRGFAGSPAARRILRDLVAPLSADAAGLLDDGAASLYAPALLDATGELCPGQADCEAGRGVGPLVDAADPRASFINVFRTTPERQERLLQATFAIMPVARRHRGYLRTALHRSLDGTRVANYGQYRTMGDIRGMYLYAETLRRFAAVAFMDATEPARVLGRPLRVLGRPVGTTPRLRCYATAHVALGRTARQDAA